MFTRLTLCLLPALALIAPAADARDLTVMSFNIRYPSPDDGPDRWETRAPIAIAMIRAQDPDLIGTQELYQRQGDAIVAALPRFRWFGRDRRGAHADEHMGIFYRGDRLRLVRSGDFWLSDTPDQVGSSSWGVDLPRMVNWGMFETLGSKPRRFVLFDTHFAHRDSDDDARRKSAELLLSRIPAIAGTLPVIVTGDMNATPDSTAYAAFAASLRDAWTGTATRDGPERTFHAFTGTADRRIDYIFVRGFTPLSARVVTHNRAGRYASDHFPVVATLRPAK
ncbi:endonuclease/exonuclease/phosphatase family protein [Sphingomonas sp. Leaf4]|uniref:endonuclease/exonuclease/phosphatase family protein n=1 Tax=Sphingomonas sp. Leaf4 TaxID=2876553 RepID=UPI001E447B94|nr:endonuclease/exonuclease/phosphatase family protein [Sphingomonas sp. Leaf4]